MEIRLPEVFPEDNYTECMKEAEQYLSPLGGRFFFDTPEGHRLSYLKYIVPDFIGTVVISIGFTEFAEKFTEIAYYLAKSRFNVLILEHRGHGYSERAVSDLQEVHIERFDDYVDDFTFFMENVVFGLTGVQKAFVLAHSMGCCIAGLSLTKAQYRDKISGAFFSSPMTNVSPKGVPEGLLFGFAKKSIRENGRLGIFKYSSPFNPNAVFENAGDTSPARFRRNMNMRIENEYYRTTLYTNSWVYEAVKAAKRLKKECRNITVPSFVMTAQYDTTIKRPSQKKFARRLPLASYHCLSDAKHSVFTSRSDKLAEALTYLYDFLGKNL